MPAIQLTEDAKKILLAYPWPGNVRQLKNITEQISIIETNREITAAILQTYLPAQNTQRLPALFGTRESKSFESEREILYSVLFDMRQEVAEPEEDGAQYDGRTCGTSRTDGTGSGYSGSDDDAPTICAGHYPCCAATVCLVPKKTMTIFRTRKNMWKKPFRSMKWKKK